MDVAERFKEVGRRVGANGKETVMLEATITLRTEVGASIPDDARERALAKMVEGTLRAEADAIAKRVGVK